MSLSNPIEPFSKTIAYGDETIRELPVSAVPILDRWTFVGGDGDVVAISLQGDTESLEFDLKTEEDGQNLLSLQFEIPGRLLAESAGEAAMTNIYLLPHSEAEPAQRSRFVIDVSAQSTYQLSCTRIATARRIEPKNLEWRSLSDGGALEALSFSGQIGDALNLVLHESIQLDTNCAVHRTSRLNDSLNDSLKMVTLLPRYRGGHVVFLSAGDRPQSMEKAGYFLSVSRGLFGATDDPASVANMDNQMLGSVLEQARSFYRSGQFAEARQEAKRLLLLLILWRAEHMPSRDYGIGGELDNIVPDTWRFLLKDDDPDNLPDPAGVYRKLKRTIDDRHSFGTPFSDTVDRITSHLNQEERTFFMDFRRDGSFLHEDAQHAFTDFGLYARELPILLGDIAHQRADYLEAARCYAIARDSMLGDPVAVWIRMAQVYLNLAGLLVIMAVDPEQMLNLDARARDLYRQIVDEAGVLPRRSALRRRLPAEPGMVLFEFRSGFEEGKDFVTELDKDRLSENLHNAFDKAGEPLSAEAAVRVVERRRSWVIRDGREKYWIENQTPGATKQVMLRVHTDYKQPEPAQITGGMAQVIEFAAVGHRILDRREGRSINLADLHPTRRTEQIPIMEYEWLLTRAKSSTRTIQETADKYKGFLQLKQGERRQRKVLDMTANLDKSRVGVEREELKRAEEQEKVASKLLRLVSDHAWQTEMEHRERGQLERQIGNRQGLLAWVNSVGPSYHDPWLVYDEGTGHGAKWIQPGSLENTWPHHRALIKADAAEALTRELTGKAHEMSAIDRRQQLRQLETAVEQAAMEAKMAAINVDLAAERTKLAIQQAAASREILESYDQEDELSEEDYGKLARIAHWSAMTNLHSTVRTVELLKQAFEAEFGVDLGRTGFQLPDFSEKDLDAVALERIVGQIQDEIQKIEEAHQHLGQIQPRDISISLKNDFPLEFELLKRKGRTVFATTLPHFQEKIPGMFNARIKKVAVAMKGIGGPYSLQLDNAGYCYYRISRGIEYEEILRLYEIDDPCALPEVTPEDEQGPQSCTTIAPQRDLFENFGLGTGWVLSIINLHEVNLGEIYDVELVFTVNFEVDQELRDQDITSLPATGTARTVFPLTKLFQKEWKRFVEDSKDLEMELISGMLPRGHRSPRLEELQLISASTSGELLRLPLKVSVFRPGTGPASGWADLPVAYSPEGIGQVLVQPGMALLERWRLVYAPEDGNDPGLDNLQEIALVATYEHDRRKLNVQ